MQDGGGGGRAGTWKSLGMEGDDGMFGVVSTAVR